MTTISDPRPARRYCARRLAVSAGAGIAVTISLLAALFAPELALGAAKKVGTQAPGFYRLMLGDFEVTALSDGTHPFPVHEVLRKADPVRGETVPLDQAAPGEADALLAESQLAVPVEGSINAFLINTGEKLILIDSGAGALYGTCCGRLVANMRAAGYTPEEVDEIYLTHLHADHVGGVAPNGKVAFANAVVRASQTDADYWLSKVNEAAAPDLLKSMFEDDQIALKPYIDAGRFKPFPADGELTPGIRAVASPGHTPGHTVYAVESRGQKLLLWGDIIHVAPIQFPDPAVTVAYDNSPEMAEKQRSAILADAARAGYWVGAAHVSFPGLGHIVAKSGRFSWVPANYDANLTRPD